MKQQTVKPPTLGIAGAYVFLSTLIFWPVFDFLSTASPFQFGSAPWRYGAVGLMASYIVTPIMGLVFAMALAFALEHRVMLRVLSVVCLIGAAFLLLAMLSLALDVLQLWRVGIPEGMPSLRSGGLVAEVKHMSGCLVLVLCGVGGWQASRRPGNAKKAPEHAPLVRPPKSSVSNGDTGE